MAQTRSPRYPNVSLNEAIQKARAIYEREHMSPLTPQVAAEAMGYSGINGASLKTISSLKKYGLLEGRGEDVRLTKDAQTLIIDDPKAKDYIDAIRRSALNPEIYSEINRQFQMGGSERNIAVYLEKQGFKPDAAKNVAQNYKETMALVSDGGEAYDGSEDDTVMDTQPGRTAPAPAVAQQLQTAAMPAAGSDMPFTIVMRGKQLEILANVDLAGLQQLKQLLDHYETILKLMEQPLVPPMGRPIKPSLIGGAGLPSDEEEN